MTDKIRNRSQYNRLIQMINADKGFDFSGYRKSTIKRRIARRIADTGADGYKGYMAILKNSEKEYSRLISDLTIKVSYFFRNPLVFELIYHHVLDDIFQQKEAADDNTLRIWSAGCAHGEEAYSMAILLEKYQRKEGVKKKEVGIFATDVDEKALKSGRRGIYHESGMVVTKLGILNKYFSHEDENYHLIDSIKNMVTFSCHNLISDTIIAPQESVFADFDIILCRNVLIYLSTAMQDKILGRIDRLLNNGGYLVLGEADILNDYMRNRLQEIIKRSKIFRKI